MTLFQSVDGEPVRVRTARSGNLCLFRAGPERGWPVLLLHSVNAAASAAEVRPLFELSSTVRPTYALDLPGFGASERSDRPYTPRLMTDAVLDALAEVRRATHSPRVHVLAVSLACEFVARAAGEGPPPASVTLVSPTGFDGSRARDGAIGSTRAVPGMLPLLKTPLVGTSMFSLLRRPAVIRYFLERTWAERAIDEAVFRSAVETARASGAHFAPLAFLSGHLFSADTDALYEALPPPVWLAHGTRGDFTDYRRADRFVALPGWSRTIFSTGALPYFQDATFFPQWQAFLAGAEALLR
ncbi:MAG: alpha/beta fold hydrolase [Myxococcaceae bacterium]|nr:alpha/beta fold hydrolase [Myxococcaceae bacterium]